MIIEGTPEWTHITRDGRKAAIVTDKVDERVYNVLAVVESSNGSGKFWIGYFTPELKYHSDDRESVNDLRPYNPLEDVKVDAPIWVKRDRSWVHRHFAYTKGGRVYAWIDGKTSFTETVANPWTHYSLTDPHSEL